MADDTLDTQLRITADDQTATVFRNLQDRMKQTQAATTKALGDTAQASKNVAEQINKAGDAASEFGDSTRRSGEQAKTSYAAVSSSVSELISRFTALAAVEEGVRRSFIDFAGLSRAMENFQFATSATDAQMQQLRGTLEEVSRITGESQQQVMHWFGQMVSSTNASREQLGELGEAFKFIADTATVTGASVPSLARSWGAAFNDLKLSVNDVNQVMATWATQFPANIQDFARVAPRLMEQMHDMGLRSKQDAVDVGLAWNQVAQALGNTRLATGAMTEMMRSMTSLSTPLGQMMLPTIESIYQKTGDTGDRFMQITKSAHDLMDQFGAFSKDPLMRETAEQTFGVSPQTLSAYQALYEHWSQIEEQAKQTGDSVDKVMAAMLLRAHDPQAALESLSSSFDSVRISVGQLLDDMGTSTVLTGFADAIRTVSDAVNSLNIGLEVLGINGKKTPWDTEAGTTAALRGAAKDATIGAGAGAAIGLLGGPADVITVPAGALAGAGIGAVVGGVSGFFGLEHVGGRTGSSAYKSSGDKQRNIPHFARGGVVSDPTVALIGEQGPEAVVPLDSKTNRGRASSDQLEDNTQATRADVEASRQVVVSLDRLSMMLRGMSGGDQRRRAAFTPGAGELPWAATAGMPPPGADADQNKSLWERLFGSRTGPSAYKSSGGAAPPSPLVTQPAPSPLVAQPAPSGVIGTEGGISAGPQVNPEGVVPKSSPMGTRGPVAPGGPASPQDEASGQGALPAGIAAEAKKAALLGGGPAVFQYMQQAGYANHGEAWCGEFAASVVHNARQSDPNIPPPPKNPALADNWAKWGTAETGAPQAGDIAVRRFHIHGHGHVTTVAGFDPKTGVFQGTGGNQGRGRTSPFRASDYMFRRPGAAATGAPAATGSTAAPQASRGLAANQQEAYSAARGEGLSDDAAKLLVADMSGESLARPRDSHWDVHHMSQGIAQWDPQRTEAIRRQFGKEPKDMSVGEQTRAAIWEMRTNPRFRSSWAALNRGGDAASRMSTVVRNYEAPGNPGAATQQRLRHLQNLHVNDTHDSILQQHRATRAEMEKPIKVNIDPPKMPHLPVRRAMPHQVTRWANENYVADARYRSMNDIGLS